MFALYLYLNKFVVIVKISGWGIRGCVSADTRGAPPLSEIISETCGFWRISLTEQLAWLAAGPATGLLIGGQPFVQHNRGSRLRRVHFDSDELYGNVPFDVIVMS